jgi:hypothetical protein
MILVNLLVSIPKANGTQHILHNSLFIYLTISIRDPLYGDGVDW